MFVPREFVFFDLAVRGAKERRPGLVQLKAALSAGAVKAVKVYRLQHRMLSAQEFAAGEDPFAPTTYLPYYLGEYDPDGHVTDPDNPLLYWVIPIVKKASAVVFVRPGGRRALFENYLAAHAGSDPFEAP